MAKRKNHTFHLVNSDHGVFLIKDTKRNVIVAMKNSVREAKKMVKRLNSGTGFQGSIPEYMFNGWKDRPTITE